MRLRDWLTSSGEEETEDDEQERSVLDEENYSEKDLREDKARLKDQRRQVESDLEEYRSSYQDLLEKGSQDGLSDEKREEIAHRANMVKKKYKASKQKYTDIRSELALVVSIEAAREVLSLVDRDKATNIGELIDSGELSTEQVSSVMEDVRVEHNLRREEMADAISALDVDMMPDDSTVAETEEFQIMKENSGDELDGDELLEADTASSTDATHTESLDELDDDLM